MERSKYIVVDSIYGQLMYIFDISINHKDFVDNRHNDGIITSAGYVCSNKEINNGEPYCGGQSLSLGVASHKEDTEILHRMLGYKS